MKKRSLLFALLLTFVAMLAMASCGLFEKDPTPDAVPEAITINKEPMNTIWYVNRLPQLEGGEITVSFTYGPDETISMTDADVEIIYDNTQAGKQTVTVKYMGLSASFEVEILDIGYEAEPLEFRIKTPPTKTIYFEDEALDPTGGVIEVYYTDDEWREVSMTSSALTFVYDFSVQGDSKIVTVKYMEFSDTKTFTVKVIKPEEPAGYGEGKIKAPDIVLNLLDGGEVKLSDYFGKCAVLISIWEINCGVCEAEEPWFKSEYAKRNTSNYNFEILSIAGNSRDTTSALNAHKESKKINFPILLDNNGNWKKGSVGQQYFNGYYPCNYLVDKWGYLYNGNISSSTILDYNYAGFSGQNHLSQEISAAINRANSYVPPSI